MTELSSDDDIRDIRATLDGDEAAFARIMGRYQALVFQQMWRFSRDPVVQEELVQEAFIAIFRSLHNYKGKAPFLHWIRRIATRTGYRHWRKRDRYAFIKQRVTDEAASAPPPGPPRTPSEAAARLHDLLDTLPPKERLILTLLYFEDCEYIEIAERMGWTVNAVRVRAHRARKKLKDQLEQAGLGSPTHE